MTILIFVRYVIRLNYAITTHRNYKVVAVIRLYSYYLNTIYWHYSRHCTELSLLYRHVIN